MKIIRAAQIAVSLGLKTCAIRQIKRNAEKILEHIKAGISSPGSAIITKHRPFVLDKTEKLLYAWILIHEPEKHTNFNCSHPRKGEEFVQYHQNLIRKPSNLIQAEDGSTSSNQLTGEAASADYEETEKFPEMLKSIIDEGGYSPRQLFNVDEAGIYWKRLPSHTFNSKQEAKTSGFKVSKDRLTVALGGNAAGDFKLKPLLVWHPENPMGFKIYLENHAASYLGT